MGKVCYFFFTPIRFPFGKREIFHGALIQTAKTSYEMQKYSQQAKSNRRKNFKCTYINLTHHLSWVFFYRALVSLQRNAAVAASTTNLKPVTYRCLFIRARRAKEFCKFINFFPLCSYNPYQRPLIILFLKLGNFKKSNSLLYFIILYNIIIKDRKLKSLARKKNTSI